MTYSRRLRRLSLFFYKNWELIMTKTILIFLFSFSVIGSDYFSSPFCVAHRANGFNEIENSFSAIRAASSYGARGIEIDVHHTKDGRTLVYHDKELKRLVKGKDCPIGRKMKDLFFQEIQQNCKLINGEAIPSLRDALKEVSLGHSHLFIEIKDNKITESDYQEVKEFFFNKGSQISFISFDSKVLHRVRSYRKRDAFFKKIKIIKLKSRADNINLAQYDGIDTKKISRYNVRKFQAQHKIVGVYTKNRKKEITSEFIKGVHFVTTDDYRLCKSILNSI